MAADSAHYKTTGGFAQQYATYGLPYASQVYDAILSYCRQDAQFNFDVAVDAACGSGRGTIPLARHFRSVVGVDFSPQQIQEAKRLHAHVTNVRFQVGVAEDIHELENDSVDLLTTASGYHWVDRERFDVEAERVLRPGGVLAAYGKGHGTLDCGADDIWQRFLYGTLDGCWPEVSKYAKNKYADFRLPMEDFQRVDNIIAKDTVTPSFLCNYIAALPTWGRYQRTNQDWQDVLNQLETDLVAASGGRDITISRANFVLLSRKKRPNE